MAGLAHRFQIPVEAALLACEADIPDITLLCPLAASQEALSLVKRDQ
jgi:hypothetical protein